MSSPNTEAVPAEQRWVTIANPTDPAAAPLYAGDYQLAHTALDDGQYRAEGPGPSGDGHQFVVTVADSTTTRESVQLDLGEPPASARPRLDPPGIRVTVRGRLTADPEIGYSDAGKSYLRLPIASNERIYRNGEWENGPAQFTQAVLFGRRAEDVYNQQPPLAKGDEIIVRGRPELDVFTRRDGNPGAALKVIATTVDRVPDRTARMAATPAPGQALSPAAQLHQAPGGTAVTGVERGDRQLQGALKQAGFKWSGATAAWELPASMPSQERWNRVQSFGQTLQTAGRTLPPLAPTSPGTPASIPAQRAASPTPSPAR